MTSEEQPRAALEKFFPKPFSDYQWNALVSLGYEDAVRTGARSAKAVAQELKKLVAAAAQGRSGSGAPEPTTPEGPPFTWDEMEKLVLGRVLAGEGPSRPEAATETDGTRTGRRKEFLRRIRGRWPMFVTFC